MELTLCKDLARAKSEALMESLKKCLYGVISRSKLNSVDTHFRQLSIDHKWRSNIKLNKGCFQAFSVVFL